MLRWVPASAESAIRNRFFAALPPGLQASLLPRTVMAELAAGVRLVEAGEAMDALILPADGALASLSVVLPGGQGAEVALCGSDALVAGGIAAPGAPFPARAMVRIGGTFLRLPAQPLRAAAPDMIARQADCFLAQLLQTIACNRRHALERRLCRWLLTLRETHGRETLPLTQGSLAELLGVQRTTVTGAALALKRRGVIRYSRGCIEIRDAAALAALACPCHRLIRRHCAAVLPAVYGRAQDDPVFDRQVA